MLAAAALLGGCATLTRGTTELLVIDSEPSAADVRLSNGLRCITPCRLDLKRKVEYTLWVVKEGYEPATIEVQSKVVGAGAAGMAGNVLIGGIIGIAVDSVSGATKGLTPNPAIIRLVPIASIAPVTPGSQTTGPPDGSTTSTGPGPAGPATEPTDAAEPAAERPRAP